MFSCKTTLLTLLLIWSLHCETLEAVEAYEKLNDKGDMAFEDELPIISRKADGLDLQSVAASSKEDSDEEGRPRGLMAALLGYPDETNEGGDQLFPKTAIAVEGHATISGSGMTAIKSNDTNKGVPLQKTMEDNSRESKENVTDTSLPESNFTTASNESDTSKLLPKTNFTEELTVNGTKAETGNSTVDGHTPSNKREAKDHFRNEERNQQGQSDGHPRDHRAPFGIQGQPLPAGYVIWHPVASPFHPGSRANLAPGSDFSTASSENSQMALPPGQGGNSGNFIPHRPFFVEDFSNHHGQHENFQHSNPFPITQFSSPPLFAVFPETGAKANNNGNEEREQTPRRRGKKPKKSKNRPGKGRPANDENNDAPGREFDRPRDMQPIHLMLPPLPPHGFSNMPMFQEGPQLNPNFGHQHDGGGRPMNHFHPPPFESNMNTGFQGQNDPRQQNEFRGNEFRGNEFRGFQQEFNQQRPQSSQQQQQQQQQDNPFPQQSIMHLHQHRQPDNQFQQQQKQQHISHVQKPTPSPSAHPAKFEIEQQKMEEQQREQQQHQHGPNQEFGGDDGPFPDAPPQPHFQPSPPPPPPHFQHSPPRPFNQQQQDQQPFVPHPQQFQSDSPPPFLDTHSDRRPPLNTQQTIFRRPSPSESNSFQPFPGPTGFSAPLQSPSHSIPPLSLPSLPPSASQSGFRNQGFNKFNAPMGEEDDRRTNPSNLKKTKQQNEATSTTSIPIPAPRPTSGLSAPPLPFPPAPKMFPSVASFSSGSPTPHFGLPPSRFPNRFPASSDFSQNAAPFQSSLPTTRHPPNPTHQALTAASHRLPSVHPNLPDFIPGRPSTLGPPLDDTFPASSTQESLAQINSDEDFSGFPTDHAGFAHGMALNSQEDLSFGTPSLHAHSQHPTTKSNFLHFSGSSTPKPKSASNQESGRGTSAPRSSSSFHYDVQYQPSIPKQSTFESATQMPYISSEILETASSRSSESTAKTIKVESSPANPSSTYKPGTSRILLEMEQWKSGNTNGMTASAGSQGS